MQNITSIALPKNSIAPGKSPMFIAFLASNTSFLIGSIMLN